MTGYYCCFQDDLVPVTAFRDCEGDETTSIEDAVIVEVVTEQGQMHSIELLDRNWLHRLN